MKYVPCICETFHLAFEVAKAVGRLQFVLFRWNSVLYFDEGERTKIDSMLLFSYCH